MRELQTLQDVIDELAEHRDRPAVLALHKEESERWIYAELADHVQRLAADLSQAGLGQGEMVALLASNRPEWLAACLAILKAGAVVVPLDVQLDQETLDHVLRDSGARFVFTTSDQLDRLEQLQLETDLKPIPFDKLRAGPFDELRAGLFDAAADEEQAWQHWLFPPSSPESGESKGGWSSCLNLSQRM